MNVSDAGVELVKKFEGLSLKTYTCPAGKLTIGYGHTGSDVKPDMVITEEEADRLLRKDLETAEKCVKACARGPMTQGQFDSLTSFAYNCGCGNLRSSTLLREFNAGNDDEAARQFLRWTKSAGKELPGLVKRRQAEMELFLKG